MSNIKNLVYYECNAGIYIGEIVQDNPQVILTQYGTYVTDYNVKELTETVYNFLNDHDKKVVDNWDHDKLIKLANAYHNVSGSSSLIGQSGN